MSASTAQTATPTPFDVLADASSFLAPELLHASTTHDSCFPPSHGRDSSSSNTKAFEPPIDQWKQLVAQEAKGVGPYSVHRHETRFLLRCDFPGLKLESLYRLLTETTRRGQWDAKLENARVVETLESPLNAVVEYYKLSGTFPIIKQRELVLLSCSATLPSTSEDKQQIIGASTSIDHPDVPPSRTHMRFHSSLSGFVFTGTSTGVQLMQMQDFGPLANYVPSSALKLALTAILPKTLLSFKNGALAIPSSGSLGFLPPRIDSWRAIGLHDKQESAAAEESKGKAPPSSSIKDEAAQKMTGHDPAVNGPPDNGALSREEASESDGDALLTLHSPTVNATIDPKEKRLSYFEIPGCAEKQPHDDQKQQWLAEVLSTDEGLRALNRLSKAVPDSELTVESTLTESSELLATPGLSESGTMTASMSSDGLEQESKLMEDLAEAIGVQMKVVEESQGDDQVRKEFEVKPKGSESSSTVSWVTSSAGRALKTASYTVYG